MRSLLRFSCQFSSVDIKRFSSTFITTPIFYVNAAPHIGHLYTALLADAYNRYKLLTEDVQTVFSVGTDEHGTKVEQAARASGEQPEEYCARMTGKFAEMFSKFDIQSTDFINTSQQRHKQTVNRVWRDLEDNGFIRMGKYEGWYCEADEAFLTESQTRLEGGVRVSAESGRPVTQVSEDNYMFNLAPFQADIIHWINSGDVVTPSLFQKQLLRQVEEAGRGSLSVSRPAARVSWAIPVPSDPAHSVYVWLDALSNYLTVAGYPHPDPWPPTHQLIGKDILKFHGLYWPAILIALGLEPPRRLVVHSHWTVDAEKMSKSRGNVVCPLAAAEKYTSDGLRYFLLREGTLHSDSNYSERKAMSVMNSELADTLGNLVGRCSSKVVNPGLVYPPLDKEMLHQLPCSQLVSSLDSLSEEVGEHFENFNFYRGVARVVGTLHETNRFFESERPWHLSKDPSQARRLASVLHLTLEVLRVVGICLQPIVPGLTGRLLDHLRVTSRSWSEALPSWQHCHHPSSLHSHKLVLYRRLQL